MPTTREVDAARAERQRRAAEAREQQRKPRTALDRRLARLEEAHARATAPARWLCRVEGCPTPGPHPAESREAAEAEAMRHYDNRHATPSPADLEEQRAAWVAAGRPPLGVAPPPPTPAR